MAALPFMLHWKFWSKLQAEGATAQLILLLGRDSLEDFALPHEVMATLAKFGLSLSVGFDDAEEAVA